jgi:outer membrane immunogenic protein
MLAPRWSVRAEYLFYDLGSVLNHSPFLLQTNNTGTPFFGVGIVSTANFTGNIARIGVNFKFDIGKGKVPVVAARY